MMISRLKGIPRLQFVPHTLHIFTGRSFSSGFDLDCFRNRNKELKLTELVLSTSSLKTFLRKSLGYSKQFPLLDRGSVHANTII